MTATVRDVALRAPVTILPDAPIREAEALLISRQASEIYVLDDAEMLLGVVPDYEILKYRLLGGDGQGRIAALMSPVTVSLSPTASLDAGAQLLRAHLHSSVPIVDGGRLIGQLCRSSLLRIFAELGYRPASEPLSAGAALQSAPKFAAGPHILRGAPVLSR